jgi:hypothetical protein
MTKCNGSYGFTKDAVHRLHGSAALQGPLRRGRKYFFKPYYRTATNLCAGRSDSNPHYNTLAPGYSWCGSFQ